MTATVEMKVRVILPAYREMPTGREKVVTLRVPCMACSRWHTHGNGVVGDEVSPIGGRDHRSAHCVGGQYPQGYWFEVQAERFNKNWVTPRGRFTKQFLRTLGLAA